MDSVKEMMKTKTKCEDGSVLQCFHGNGSAARGAGGGQTHSPPSRGRRFAATELHQKHDGFVFNDATAYSFFFFCSRTETRFQSQVIVMIGCIAFWDVVVVGDS